MSLDNTYRSFEDLPIYNFYQIIESKDVSYFYKNFIKGDSLEIEEEDEMELLDRFQKVFDDRIDYSNDIKSKEYYRKVEEMRILNAKLYRMKNNYNTMIEIPHTSEYFKRFLDDFCQEGFTYTNKIENDEERASVFDWMRLKIKRFENKVKARKLQYKDILEAPLKETGKKFDLMREKILLEESLGRIIDIYTCSVKEWTALVIRAEEKAKAQQAQLEKVKNKRR